ncbi:MAG: coiled-coil domain-containing protein [Phycisphaeraceae bacterium JB051]
MSRRNRDDGEMSLFPFLSILVCLIGVLTLMIVGVSIAQMNTPDIDELLKNQEELEEVKKELTELEKKKLELQEFIKMAQGIKNQLNDALKKLRDLEEMKKAAQQQEKLAAEAVELLAEIQRLEKQIKQLTKELEEIQKKIAKLEEELKKRLEKPVPEVQIQPSGSEDLRNGKIRPTFVETTKEGVRIHTPQGQTFVTSRDMRNEDKAYMQLVKESDERKDRMIIFLIRSDAIRTFDTAKALADKNHAYNSRLPIVGQGRVDLSLFFDSMKK